MCLYYIYRWKKAEYTVSVRIKEEGRTYGRIFN